MTSALPEVLEKLERVFPGHVQLWGDSIEMRSPDDTQAVADILNWLKEHGPALLRDAGDGVDYKSKLHAMHRRAQKAEAELANWKLWANVGWGFKFDKVSAAVNALGRLTDSFRAIEKLRRTRRLSEDTAMHAPGGAGGGD